MVEIINLIKKKEKDKLIIFLKDENNKKKLLNMSESSKYEILFSTYNHFQSFKILVENSFLNINDIERVNNLCSFFLSKNNRKNVLYLFKKFPDNNFVYDSCNIIVHNNLFYMFLKNFDILKNKNRFLFDNIYKKSPLSMNKKSEHVTNHKAIFIQMFIYKMKKSHQENFDFFEKNPIFKKNALQIFDYEINKKNIIDNENFEIFFKYIRKIDPEIYEKTKPFISKIEKEILCSNITKSNNNSNNKKKRL